jgi:hypothetical protein
MIVWYRREGVDGKPVLEEGQTLPKPCPACGAMPRTRTMTVTVVSTREEVEELRRRDAVARQDRL